MLCWSLWGHKHMGAHVQMWTLDYFVVKSSLQKRNKECLIR